MLSSTAATVSRYVSVSSPPTPTMRAPSSVVRPPVPAPALRDSCNDPAHASDKIFLLDQLVTLRCSANQPTNFTFVNRPVRAHHQARHGGGTYQAVTLSAADFELHKQQIIAAFPPAESVASQPQAPVVVANTCNVAAHAVFPNKVLLFDKTTTLDFVKFLPKDHGYRNVVVELENWKAKPDSEVIQFVNITQDAFDRIKAAVLQFFSPPPPPPPPAPEPVVVTQVVAPTVNFLLFSPLPTQAKLLHDLMAGDDVTFSVPFGCSTKEIQTSSAPERVGLWRLDGDDNWTRLSPMGGRPRSTKFVARSQ